MSVDDNQTTDELEGIPPEEWIVQRPFDSSDYLDGEPPSYAEDPEGEAGLLGEFAPEPESQEVTDG